MSQSPPARPRVLVADDDPAIREALRILLRSEQIDVAVAASPQDAAATLEQSTFDLALLDLNYARNNVSGQEGLALLDRLRTSDPALPILVMTGWGTISGAVEAMQRGARDYIQKPWEDERLIAAVKSHLALRHALVAGNRLREANARLQEPLSPKLIASAPAMSRVLETVDRVADSEAAVLITGEHGTGKEVLARLVHQRSGRALKSFVTMNAGGLSSGVAESELFGHLKGAFTDARADRIGVFELADEGTLFLDEIGNMPSSLQPALLRVLQTGEIQRVGSSRTVYVNVRIVSATNTDLGVAIERGMFREDLFYRLNTVVVHLPPLRDRPEDILPLAEHYLHKFATKYARPAMSFDESARRVLTQHAWPGNIRELTHAVERGVLMARDQCVTARDLSLGGGENAKSLSDAMTLEDVEKVFIRKVLDRCEGDVRKAAAQLGMSRSALYRRLQNLSM